MKKEIFSIFILTLIYMGLILLGAPFFNYIATSEWTWIFIGESNYSAWIGYYGAVTGGAFTLAGVWWTIKKQDKIRADENLRRDAQRKEELSAQYKPILSPYIEQTLLLLGVLTCNIKLINQGRGEAINVNISSSTKTNEYISKILADEYSLVEVQQEMKLQDCIIADYDYKNETMTKIQNKLGASYKSFITSNYFDIFGNECNLSFEIEYNCSVELKATDIKDLINPSNSSNINLDKPPTWTAAIKNIKYN